MTEMINHLVLSLIVNILSSIAAYTNKYGAHVYSTKLHGHSAIL